MRQPARRNYSLDDYYDVELYSELKYEYFDGEIFAMAGGSTPHNLISGSLFLSLGNALRGTSCAPFGSDQRVYAPSGLYSYPDASAFCYPHETEVPPPGTLTNAVALFEVLSDATRDYDKGAKFELYRSIPTLRDYVLIEQSEMRVEHRSCGEDGNWTTKMLVAPDEVLEIVKLGFRVELREIYERVSFD